MYSPNAISWLSLVVCVVWTTAGFALLLYSGRSHSRPDFMAGLGLLLGGILTGLCSTPIAGQGVFPFESLILGLCCLWCFGFGEPDEATALQVGDRWAPSLAMGSLSLTAFLLVDNIGAQPVLWIGAELRPFELVGAVLFGYLWQRSLSLPTSLFSHLPRKHVSCMLVACLGASLAGLFGGAHADLGRFIILGLGPIPYLLVGIRGKHLGHILAVSLSMALACLSLTYAFHMRDHRAAVQEIQAGAIEMSMRYSELHEQLREALEGRAYRDSEMRYGKLSDALAGETTSLLMGAAQRVPRPGVQRALHEFLIASISHSHWGAELFRAGSDGREARARESREKARLALVRGNNALTDLQRELVTASRFLGADTEQMAGLALALLTILAMLGAALLRVETEDSAANELFYVHIDPPPLADAAAERVKKAEQRESALLR